MDRLTAVKVFVEIAARGSLTQTAEQLEMSQAMVSRYLATVENWLGARLLHRTTRKISLTEAGLAALPLCRQMLDFSLDLQHIGSESKRTVEGTLRISTSPSFAEAQLTAALRAFQRVYPQVRVDLQVADRTVNLVEDRIDLAIRISNSLPDNVVAKPLADCRSVLCATPSYLERHGIPRSHQDLAAHRFVLHTRIYGKHLSLKKGKERFSLPLSGQFSSNETGIVLQATKQHAGIAMLPTYCVADDLKQGRLIRLLADYRLDTLGIYAIYLSRRHQPLALRTLIDFLADYFAGESAVWDRDLLQETAMVRKSAV
ncbi:LysR family transcriptional regulator [Chelonobacter oris]|uniref:LysR family transcriptional regulator n=1 Tax=Chelonobacter oris TaxID=505317 RepID=A0A0A3AK09_9PAST|nr:LysR family transcriptional regulator [Chelonobacter oris]KGQ69641.1 LysR family transcriptional regulator [Chelonobacter oris]MDH3000298.1 LysR family transcriptional regulator [Chelonobacter oris]